MPELPEVETIVSTLRPQISGTRVCGLEILAPKTVQGDKNLLVRALPGMTVGRVYRRAKLLLLECSRAESRKNMPDALVLAFHLKMTGSFFVHPADAVPLKHTRLVIDLESPAPPPAGGRKDGIHGRHSGKRRLFFDDVRTFGFCRPMLPEDMPHWEFWKKLGPEPLETSPEKLAEIFSGHGGGIKGLLLNQTVVAGIGNIYADESLFRAGIHPAAKAGAIPRARLLVLAKSLQTILKKSIKECGSSIRDYRDAFGNAGAFQNSFSVYSRGGKPCLHCSSSLQTMKTAGRTTTFCPRCQKRSW
ncbi:MAG: bifunctional DNA-formamidopyrimidine glycosylase/DNA-(apurinic or apyrimidinic site) lyase [Desulfovibrio sp.]|jgi:formamidopyrimidine-DNA glycosylase|nr:bifunctional DNA-formamidopyrimidine glycosylase/DNA-(apurinic or apyrimidinic site) lyase [Desulfovibrio sp.]